jgi:hypothetical protein
MANYIDESIYDLLTSDLESISDSAFSQGSYHPSRECFMAEIVDNPHREATPKGHVTSANDGTPHGGTGLPRILPYPRMNQLRERQQELETA